MASANGAPRVLIVTGDEALGHDLGRRLEGLGYVPFRAAVLDGCSLGRSADLVLLDVCLSDGDARETTGRACRQGVPVVIVAERLDRRILHAAGEAGAYGCVVQDTSDRELLATLEMALHRFRLDRLPDRILDRTVIALTLVSEERDPFTAGHQQRVSRLAEAIALELGLDADDREGVRLAGLVHDIGKVHVPSEILAKPEALSALERGIVQGHCDVGYEILRDVPFPWPVARMVLEHHERLDGSGYPAGLAGEAILPGARILAVADVVEAMTAHRPYRTALPLELALAELRDGSGTRYDAAVAAACLAVCLREGLDFLAPATGGR